jgi:hypothetical protein
MQHKSFADLGGSDLSAAIVSMVSPTVADRSARHGNDEDRCCAVPPTMVAVLSTKILRFVEEINQFF